jgi:hypothetical protein
MEVFIQVFIALSLYEFLYWSITEILLNIREKTNLDQEAKDYLSQIKSKSDSQESQKNKKD